MSLPQDDPRLTAFLLGELDDGEARRLREELAANQEISEELKALQGVSNALREELLEEIGPGLKDEQLYALQSRIDLIEGHEQGNGATPGAGPKWYMRLELWMPLSAAMGFLVALIIFASTTPWLVEGIRPPQRGSEPISIGEIPEPQELNEWEKDMQEWKTPYLPIIFGAEPLDFYNPSDQAGSQSYTYVDSNPVQRASAYPYLRIPMTNDDLALRTILQRLEAGQWPVNGMLRYEQALAALNPGDQYSAGVTLLERINPWNQNSRLVMVIYTASDMDQNNKYLLVKFKDDVPGLRYRLWGYEDRIHQSGKSDMKDWQLKAGSSVAMVFEVIGGFTGIADLIEVKVGSTWAESDRVDVVSGKVSGEALDQAILLRSFMGSLKAKENPYSLDQKQVESYLGGIPDGPNKVMLERFWYLLTKEKR